MNVGVGKVLAQAFRIVLQNRVLWALSFLLILLSTGLSLSVNLEYDPATVGEASSYPTIATANSILGWVGPLVSLACMVLLRPAIAAALIAGGDRAARGATPDFRETVEAGRARMWRVLALDVILWGVILAVVLILTIVLACLLGTMLVRAVADFPGGGFGAFMSHIATVLDQALMPIYGALLVLALVLFALSIIVTLGHRAVVLDNKTVGQAWSTGWRLLRTHAGRVLLLALCQLAALIIPGLISGPIVSELSSLPGLALGQEGTGGNEGLAILLGVLVGLMSWLLSGLLLALPNAWVSVCWTLFYRAVEPQAAGIPGQATYGGPPAVGGAGYPPGYPPGPYTQPPQPGGYSAPGQYPERPSTTPGRPGEEGSPEPEPPGERRLGTGSGRVA